MPSAAADIFAQAAGLNRHDPRRHGCVVHLEGGAEVIATGDLHGQCETVARIVAYADLARRAERRLILQEIIHGPIDPATGHDRSVDLLLRVARLKVDHAESVLFVMGNHDLAQVTGNEITKDGMGVCKRFAAGVDYAFGEDGPEVIEAIREFLLSMPLAVRCPNKVWVSHSLPSPGRPARLPDETYRPEDLRRGGPVYEWTWGRRHTPEQIEQLAAELDVEFFVIGHGRVDEGCDRLGKRAVMLATDHPHGCVIRLLSGEPLNDENVASHVIPVAALGAGA